jgi:hypothetical protein
VIASRLAITLRAASGCGGARRAVTIVLDGPFCRLLCAQRAIEQNYLPPQATLGRWDCAGSGSSERERKDRGREKELRPRVIEVTRYTDGTMLVVRLQPSPCHVSPVMAHNSNGFSRDSACCKQGIHERSRSLSRRDAPVGAHSQADCLAQANE